MCIRDRLQTVGEKLQRLTDRGRQFPVKEFHRVSHFNPTGICLLYTSDAADERSSVDLGGRRIIKKHTTDDNDVLRRL